MQKFYIDDVPSGQTTAKFLHDQTDFWNTTKHIAPSMQYPKVLALSNFPYKQDALIASIHEALSLYGDHGWRHADGVSDLYTGFSLTHNPAHDERANVHSSSLGAPNFSIGTFTYEYPLNAKPKDTYSDTYAFTKRTPAGSFGELGLFLNHAKRTLIRSRVAVIHAERFTEDLTKEFWWHRDETIFENLRINIPIETAPEYLFQIEEEEPRHLGVGFGYTWDTNKRHRVFAEKPSVKARTHLVLGFSCWFDYVHEERAWMQNEFFGKMHPFDMLREGHIFEEAGIYDE